MNGPGDQGSRRVPDAAAAPPTVPGPIPVRRSLETWVRVLGVISVVLGGLGIVGGAWNAIAAALAPRVIEWMPTDEAAARTLRDAMARWMPWQVAAGVALGLSAILLLACGIGMLRRRRWSVRLAWAWIVLKVAVVTGSVVVTGLQQRDQWAAMAQSGTPLPQAMAGTMGAVSAVFSWAWGVLYPAILCVWLARGSIRRQVAEWT